MVGAFNESIGIELDGMSKLLEESQLVTAMTRTHEPSCSPLHMLKDTDVWIVFSLPNMLRKQ
jgi:hypothetical protein